MDISGGRLRVSAGDLAKHLACRHLTALDLKSAHGEIARVYRNDPTLVVLEERGFRHEAAYLSHLKQNGIEIVEGRQTIEAMRSGAAAIVQAKLEDGRWRGRADVLLRVNTPSELGNWSYEVVDTKLARETRGGTILQL